MDPNTGEILAMAIRPTLILNNYSQYPQENRKISWSRICTNLDPPSKSLPQQQPWKRGIVKPQTQFSIRAYSG